MVGRRGEGRSTATAIVGGRIVGGCSLAVLSGAVATMGAGGGRGREGDG